MTEIYETKFNICNHFNSVNPLASVQFNEAEDYLSNTLYEGYLGTFIYRELGKKLNMSFDDFINRPRHEIEMMLKVIDEADKKRLKASEKALQELQTQNTKPSE